MDKKAILSGKALWLAEHLREGEHYAGIQLGKNGAPDEHLILLPGENKAPWAAQIAWANSIGGLLPSRREQRLLFANLPEQFKRDWYWSGEQHADSPDYAWMQVFDDGSQNYYH